ncbi:MAG: S1 RNA-binding domain-containing protein [Clostridia bacterium]|nr:S1 RNA-binding domain-containing protein [Clostridia bacterium]
MQLEVGAVLEGKVTGITKFGVFVELDKDTTGMVHISEVASTYVNEIKDHVKEGETVKVKVLQLSDDGKISLSIKRALEPERRPARDPRPVKTDWVKKPQEPASFEDMMAKFKQSSDEKFMDLKRKNGEMKRTSRRAQR